MIAFLQAALLPVAVFLLVTGLWLKLVFPSEKEARSPRSRAKFDALVVSLLPAIAVGAFGGLVWYFTGEAIFATIAFGSGFAIATLLRRSGRRRAEVQEGRNALAAIETATRVLRAGIPMPGMLEVLARDAEGDAGASFKEVLRREELGEPLADAIRSTLLRSDLAELRAFGMALLVHVEVGGNLVDICDRLGKTILERGRIQRRAEAIVTYGRIAGGVLSIAPFVVVPVVGISIDDYFDLLFNRPVGNALLVVALVMVIVGTFMLQRMAQVIPDQAREIA
ncbi:MAG: hypothetical protein CMJ34_07530 [Phycisphaerae bacterium]|nr:hypothetical protein [Phycisphaerae bacterium]